MGADEKTVLGQRWPVFAAVSAASPTSSPISRMPSITARTVEADWLHGITLAGRWWRHMLNCSKEEVRVWGEGAEEQERADCNGTEAILE